MLVNSSVGTLSLVLQNKLKKASSTAAVVTSVGSGANDPGAVSSLHNAGLHAGHRLPLLQPSPEYIALKLARQRKISDSLSSLQDTSDEVGHCCQELSIEVSNPSATLPAVDRPCPSPCPVKTTCPSSPQSPQAPVDQTGNHHGYDLSNNQNQVSISKIFHCLYFSQSQYFSQSKDADNQKADGKR